MSGYIQLLCHLIGDYLFQNDWQALNKKRKDLTGWLAVTIHGILYTLPFWIAYQLGLAPLMWLWPTLGLIFISHVIIDHWNFPTWYTKRKNVKYIRKGSFVTDSYHRGVNSRWTETQKGPSWYLPTSDAEIHADARFLGRPAYIGVWLLIITDNIMHLVLNYAIIKGTWILYEYFSMKGVL